MFSQALCWGGGRVRVSWFTSNTRSRRSLGGGANGYGGGGVVSAVSYGVQQALWGDFEPAMCRWWGALPLVHAEHALAVGQRLQYRGREPLLNCSVNRLSQNIRSAAAAAAPSWSRVCARARLHSGDSRDTPPELWGFSCQLVRICWIQMLYRPAWVLRVVCGVRVCCVVLTQAAFEGEQAQQLLWRPRRTNAHAPPRF